MPTDACQFLYDCKVVERRCVRRTAIAACSAPTARPVPADPGKAGGCHSSLMVKRQIFEANFPQ